MSKKNILILLPSLATGGAERDIVRVAPLIDRERFNVVVALFSEAGELAEELRRTGVRVVWRCETDERSPGLRGGNRWSVGRAFSLAARIPRVILWIGRVLRSENISVAHFVLPHSYAYGMIASRVFSRRTLTVMSRLSLNFYEREHRTFAWFERSLLHPRLDVAVANSQLIVDELVGEGIPPNRVRLIPNGLASSEFAYSDDLRRTWRESLDVGESAFVMTAVGNLHPYKGHLDLMQACALAADSLPVGWLLLIAGRDVDGHREALQAAVDASSLRDHVRFLGSVENVQGVLSASDLFVHPSHHEGVPNAVLEAMAASLPVVATAVGGVPEAMSVEPGEETGWLVDARRPRALAEALVEAAGDPEVRARRGSAGRRRVESEFALESCVSAYEALYASLVR